MWHKSLTFVELSTRTLTNIPNWNFVGKHRILWYIIKTCVSVTKSWSSVLNLHELHESGEILHKRLWSFCLGTRASKNTWSSEANLHRSWGTQWKPMGAPALNRDFESTAYCLHGAPCLIKPFLRSSSPILTKVVELSSGIWSLKKTWSSRVNLHGFLELNP